MTHDDTIKSGQKKFPRSSEKFHSSTIKDDDENFQEPAIKNLKLNAEENHMKVMNILNSIVGEDYNCINKKGRRMSTYKANPSLGTLTEDNIMTVAIMIL
ncbi:unnamed protein product [Gordionus sp. m RMFG-2023]